MAAPRPQTACRTMLATNIAKPLAQEVQLGLQALEPRVTPHLVGFLANDDEGARMYAEWTQRTCADNGFAFTLTRTTPSDIETALLAANADPSVHGIIVYYPIHGNRQDQYLQNIVDAAKDVEGLCHTYIFNLYQNRRFLDAPPETVPGVTPDAPTVTTDIQKTSAPTPTQKSILPCTPLAILKILEYLHVYNPHLSYGDRLFGRTITVINRSEVVGRPLAALLSNDGALVYSVDVGGVQQFTRGKGIRGRSHAVVDLPAEFKLEDALRASDVVISGVPGEAFKVPMDAVRDGAVCVNFASGKNFPPEVKDKASIYVPAIGKVTIVILLRNLLRLVQNQQKKAVTQQIP